MNASRDHEADKSVEFPPRSSDVPRFSKSDPMRMAQRGSPVVSRILPYIRVSRRPRYTQEHLVDIAKEEQAQRLRVPGCPMDGSCGEDGAKRPRASDISPGRDLLALGDCRVVKGSPRV